MAADVPRTRALFAFSLTAALLGARLLYGFWVYRSLGGSVVLSDEDVRRRISSAEFWDAPHLDAVHGGLPLHQALLGLLSNTLDNLLLAPAVFGTLCVAMLVAGLYGISRELFRSTPEAAPVAVLLVLFAPIYTWFTLSSHPAVLGLALASLSLWSYLSWRRTARRPRLIGAALLATLACWTCTDAWLLVLPYWLMAVWDAFRRHQDRGLSRKGATLVGLLGLTGILSWMVTTAIAGSGPFEGFRLMFQAPAAAPQAGQLLPSFLELAMLAPMLILGLFMSFAGAQVTEIRFPIGKVLLATLILMVSSVTIRASRDGQMRLFEALVLLTPLIGGGTTAAVLQGVDRPRRWLAFVWGLVILQAGGGFFAGFNHEPARPEQVALGRTLRDLEQRAVISDEQIVVLELPDKLGSENARHIGVSAVYARVYSPRTVPTVLLDEERRRMKAVEMGEVLKKFLAQKRAPIVIAALRPTAEALREVQFESVGRIGKLEVFVHPARAEALVPAVATSLRRFAQTEEEATETAPVSRSEFELEFEE